MSSSPPLLLEQNIGAYLLSRGLNPGRPMTSTPLTDGVSALVYRVDTPQTHWVVKQALAELRVSTQWTADPHRATTEARALKLLGDITPDVVPRLIDDDPSWCSLIMTAAPPEWSNWRSLLLSLREDPRNSRAHVEWAAETLGCTLGAWHGSTWGQESIARQFSDHQSFEELRIAPFHRAVRSTFPALADRLDELIEELTTVSECLVHGDFSPKNVLIGLDGLWVLDFEVARFGAAIFDVAFLAHHLALKTIARPSKSDDITNAFEIFLGAYTSTVGHALSFEKLGWHAAALMLARVDGVSLAPYLSPRDQDIARQAALHTLSSPDSSNATFWKSVSESARGTLK